MGHTHYFGDHLKFQLPRPQNIEIYRPTLATILSLFLCWDATKSGDPGHDRDIGPNSGTVINYRHPWNQDVCEILKEYNTTPETRTDPLIRTLQAVSRVTRIERFHCSAYLTVYSWLTNVDGMKDLWCSTTAQLLSTNGKIYGALVQFGCYQHSYEQKGLWCSSTVWPLLTQT